MGDAFFVCLARTQGTDEELGKQAILKLMDAVDETIPTVRS